ncbi:uncharacterized protein LOC119736263 [Patiria miniata]|uniref:Uncharacterized protein n=1 Tax=Patiria miniata TaxID=46514 RepID=A0A914ARF0_PATMI|nr:uncharacterized protein LOC119736263 [Patiria miniata]
MASRALLILLAVAMVFSLATAFYELDDDLDFEALEQEMEKRDNDRYEELMEMDKRSFPRCRHWLTNVLCRCDNKYGKFEEERYYCMSRQRGYKGSVPFR